MTDLTFRDMVSQLVETTVADLRSSDVGSRIVLTKDGNAFDGLFVALNVRRSDYDIKGRDKITATLEAQTDGAKISLTVVPLDYKVQIERGGK